jgi:hypothetical protein
MLDATAKRVPVTISDMIDYLAQRPITVDRWWVACLIEWHEIELMAHKASVPDRPRHEVAPGNLKQYFDVLTKEYRSILSLLL